jgi:bifunctional non-homologous end joining protein LigD
LDSGARAGHVGTGFDQAMLKSLYGTMQPLRADKKPFDQKVKDENTEMRHPAFLGLRTDKKALDVIRERT